MKKGYKETAIGVIPEEWEVKKLGEVCEIVMGQSPSSSSYSEDEGIPLIQGNADIKNRLSSPRINTTSPTKLCKKDDILMTVRAPVGAIALSKHNACIGRGVCSFTNFNNDKSYLFQYMIGFEPMWSTLSQGTTFTAVNGTEVKNLEIPLPPLPEQKRIAEILTTVDEKIQVVEDRISQATTLKKGLMQKLFSEGIGHSEFQDSPLGKIPKSWEVKKLGEVCEVKGGKRLPKGRALLDSKTPYPYIRVSDMKNGGVDLSDIKFVPADVAPSISRYRIPAGSLFISVAGTIGIIGFVPSELHMANLTENANMLVNVSSDISYFFQYLTSEYVKRFIDNSTTNNAQPKLAIARIKEFDVPLPSLPEQKQIAEILTTADEKIQVLQDKKSAYQELKKGLMQKLLTGEIRTVA